MLERWLSVSLILWTCFKPYRQDFFHTEQPTTSLFAYSGKESTEATDADDDVESVAGGEVSIVYDPKTLQDSVKQGCNLIRLRRYIGSKARNCTTLKPVKFAFCGGFCLPKFRISQLKVSSLERILEKSQFQYQCETDQFHHKKIRVFCQDDGSIADYRIKVVTSCKCKEVVQRHNMLETPQERRKREDGQSV